MAFYFALFNVSAINLEEHGKRQHYRELKKSRHESNERRRQRCRSADGRQKTAVRRSVGDDQSKTNATAQPNDNASTSGPAEARQEGNFPAITSRNGSLDSIPFGLNDYRNLPQPKIVSSGKRKKEQNKKKGSITTDSSDGKASVIANGDVRRVSTDDVNDQTQNDTVAAMMTPPVTTPPAASDLIKERCNTQIALIRRGSTPSYKRVTFRYEQSLMSTEEASTAQGSTDRGTERGPIKSPGGFFSKPVNFLGGLSLDDQHRHLQKRSSAQDRPPELNAVPTGSHNSCPEGAIRHPSSALGKLHAVIQKLITENRRQRVLASHWPRPPTDGKCQKTETDEEVIKATPTTSTQIDFESRHMITREKVIPPVTPTPTPTAELPLTPMTEQIRINFQNMANSMLEMQQNERTKHQRQEKTHQEDAPLNLCDRSLSTPLPYQISPRAMKNQALVTPPRHQWQRHPLSGIRQFPSYQRLRHHQPNQISSSNGRPMLIHPRETDVAGGQDFTTPDAIGHLSMVSSVEHRPLLRSQSPQHQSCHRDLRKRWSAIVEGAITRKDSMAGSYHPRLAEHQAKTRNQFASPDKSQKERQPRHRKQEEESPNRNDAGRPQSMFQKLRTSRWPSGNRERKQNSEDSLLSPLMIQQREAQKQKGAPDRRKEANEKNEQTQSRPAALIRRRSTTDRKKRPDKSRSLFSPKWPRWLTGNSEPLNRKKAEREPVIRSRHRHNSDSDETTDFQALLNSVRYDENRNLSYDEGTDESGPFPMAAQRRYFRQKQVRSLIVGVKDDMIGQISEGTKTKWRRRLPINCYINPLFASQSAPNSPAKLDQSSVIKRQQQYQGNHPLCAIKESVDTASWQSDVKRTKDPFRNRNHSTKTTKRSAQAKS